MGSYHPILELDKEEEEGDCAQNRTNDVPTPWNKVVVQQTLIALAVSRCPYITRSSSL
jgi:hypothetical protein